MLYYTLYLCLLAVANGQYEVPEATIEVLSPRGFRVSIPDEEGIKLFAFHGKINEEMEGREGGTFSRDILKAKNGRWTFTDKTTKLKMGDILYYWTYVDYFDGIRKLGYTNDDQMYVVKDMIDVRINNGSGSCIPSVTVANVGNICKGKVIFQEDFNSHLENSKYWTIEQRYADAPDYEFVLYMNKPETLQVQNNNLKIKPILSEDILGADFVTTREGYNFGDSCTGVKGSPDCRRIYEAGFILPPVVSSRINTKGKFFFKYGTIEIRAKLPKGDWIYPELYLNPEREEYGPHYESGQIRIAFVPGNLNENMILHGGIILGDETVARNYGDRSFQTSRNWSNDFHKFSVVWKPEEISFAVDDRVYATITPPGNGFSSLAQVLNINTNRWKTGSKLAPFDKEMYITLGVGVGGLNFNDRNDDSKPWKNKERLWQKKFIDVKDKWKNTWSDSSSLIIDYVKVTAL